MESERRCDDRVTTDTRGFISNLPPKVKPLLQVPRRHWRGPSGCENTHHWVLDIAFGEDDSRIRAGHAAHNMAIPGASPTSGWRAAWHKDYLCRLIGLKPKPIWMQPPCPVLVEEASSCGTEVATGFAMRP